MIVDSDGGHWWTTGEVAEFWGILPRSVRDTMIRHKVPHNPDVYGPRGKLLYPVEQVKHAKATAPGPGNRTNHPRKKPKGTEHV